MKKSELKQLIKECVSEIIKENTNKMSIEEFAKVLKDNGFEVEFRNTTDMTRRGGAKRYLDFSKKYVNGDIIDGTAVEQFSKNLGNDWQTKIGEWGINTIFYNDNQIANEYDKPEWFLRNYVIDANKEAFKKLK